MANQFIKLPDWIYENQELNAGDKILLSLINSFRIRDEDFYMSNKTIGIYLSCKESNVSEKISKLKEKGYIQSSTFTHNNITRRKLFLVYLPKDHSENRSTPSEKHKGVFGKA